MKFTAALYFILSYSVVFAQLTEVVLPLQKGNTRSLEGARIQSLSLPFWEDFSGGESLPNAVRWVNGGVWVSRGMGIFPPSLGVASFDGVDADGKPYSRDMTFANGEADSLKSQPIDLSPIAAAGQSSVYLSFYYQFWGNGEYPDFNDTFNLYFLTREGIWKKVWSPANDGTLVKDKFVQVFIPLADPLYFFSGFQFKFQNRARLSGPYDSWHLDYIYLNANRNGTETSMPDRTAVSELSPLFNKYYALPIRHLKSESQIGKPVFWINNLRQGNIQPMNFNSWAKITTYKNQQNTSADLTLDEAKSAGGVEGLTPKTAAMEKLPAVSYFDGKADSIRVFLKLGLSTKDNVEIKDNGDYDPAKYAPIDFRVNDTLRQSVLLQDYYAYDDGSAEYGASLGQVNARMAYRFDIGVKDTVYAVDIYFPQFSDNTSRVVTLEFYADNNGTPANEPLTSQVVTVVRSTKNKFVTFKLNTALEVDQVFYVGWKQSSNDPITVGLDKSGDSGDKIFVKMRAAWEQNKDLKGNLMIRPRFGKSPVLTGVESPVYSIYPQPVRDVFFLPEDAAEIRVTDLLGRPVAFTGRSRINKLEVTLQTIQGMYIVTWQSQGRPRAEKIVYLGK